MEVHVDLATMMHNPGLRDCSGTVSIHRGGTSRVLQPLVSHKTQQLKQQAADMPQS